MRRHGAILVVLGTALIASCAAGADPDHLYLQGRSFGPYVGQVVDAETRAPIEGAVVVASWWRDRMYPGQSVSERYRAREVLTDKDGRFVLDVKELEETAPRRTLHPSFTVFFPGYMAYTSAASHSTLPFKTRGFVQGKFSPEGILVGLPLLRTLNERRDHLLSLGPSRRSDDPGREIPHYVRLVNQEARAVGLAPYSIKEQRQ